MPLGIASSFTSANKTTDGYDGSSEFAHSLLSSLTLFFNNLLYKFHTLPELTIYLALNVVPLSNLTLVALLSSTIILSTSVL